jgi:hypothetical protein
MSDTITSATPSPAAPVADSTPVETPTQPTETQTTPDASSSIQGDSLDSAITDAWADAGLDGSTDDPDVKPTTPVESEPVTPEVDDDPFLKFLDEEGIQRPTKGKDWTSRIHLSKVKKIVENAQKRAADDHQKALGEHTGKLTAYEQQLQAIGQVEQIMANDPEKFLAMLPSINPAYAEIIQRSGQRGPRQSQNPQDGAPQPDLQFSDGSLGYSAAAAQKLAAWEAQQVEAKIAARFAPLEKEYKAQQFAERVHSEILPQVNAQIAEARTWPQFKENEAAIVKTLTENPKFSLERAYQQVVLPKLTGDRSKLETDIRAKVLAEINAKPRSTSTSATTPVARQESGDSLDARLAAAFKTAGIAID